MSQHHASEAPTSDQISFARHNFENHQSMIRAADTKAGVLITLLLFLGASTIPLGRDVVPRLRWEVGGGAIVSGVYLLSYAVFATEFVWALIEVYYVVSPRGATHYIAPKAGHDLIYYDHVLLHKDSTEYFEAVSRASAALILRNLTDQVFQLANICKAKMDGLHKAKRPVAFAFSAWLSITILGFWIMRWK
jgi:hypothetical protein